MFFKRLSRSSRQNSYVDDDYDNRPRSQDNKYHHDESPHTSALQHNIGPTSPTKETTRDMYPRTSHAPQDPYTRGAVNVPGSRQNSAAFEAAPPMSAGGKVEQTPDLLTRAFNDAVRPYSEKIESLENQLADMQTWVDQLEQQRTEMYAWIDKRGLRPGELPLRNLLDDIQLTP
jgi:hypothetical protein